MTAAEFQHIAPTLPHQPGIYKYFDKNNVLLYVGKAKDLRKRVSSYFTKSFTTYKTHELVQRIHHINFTIVDSEQDAFILENSLIKQFLPKYNINLKDDKTYPYIVIKNEAFPRVFFTRKIIKDGSLYIGPYTSVGKVKELLEFIKQSIPLRNCTLPLSPKNIAKGKFKVCLEYHLKNCKGPCEALQSEADYSDGVSRIKDLLRGNLAPVIKHFKNEMKLYATSLEFEKAEWAKQKTNFLETYQSRSVIANPRYGDLDVFTLKKEDDTAYINYLMVQNGTIVQTETNKAKIYVEETESEILTQAIVQLRERFHSLAKEIVVPIPIEYPAEQIKITIPKSGDKKKLIALSEKNVAYFIQEARLKQRLHLTNSPTDKELLLTQLQKDLQLSSYPAHIECFDNSNFQGSFPVSAMVCFKDGMPSKKDYRHFNVKTVIGINDFATMKEAVYRRYKRLKEENAALPDLVIIDGGKGQLSSALEAIDELELNGKTTLVGLAKNEEELFFATDKESIKLPYNSNSLKLIRQIRDEVHRFGISFHRKQRSRGTFKNELEAIPGISKLMAEQLLKKFRSVKKVAAADEAAIASITGKAKAKKVLSYLQK